MKKYLWYAARVMLLLAMNPVVLVHGQEDPLKNDPELDILLSTTRNPQDIIIEDDPDAGKPINTEDDEYTWAERNWFEAAEQGDLALMQQIWAKDLFEGDIDIKQVELDRTALSVAAGAGKAHIIEWLLSQGADPNTKDVIEDAPIHRVVSNDYEGTIEALRELLADKRTDINIQDVDKNTALYNAIAAGKWDMVDLLIADPRLNVNIQTEDNLTARDVAILVGRFDIADQLEKKGTRVNPEIDKMVRWYHAAMVGDRAGIQAGIDQKLKTDLMLEGWEPLHVATKNKQHEAMNMLISYGANVNAQTILGNTSLHFAVTNQDQKAIEILLAHGARGSLTLRNQDDETPETLLAGITDPTIKLQITTMLSKAALKEQEAAKADTLRQRLQLK